MTKAPLLPLHHRGLKGARVKDIDPRPLLELLGPDPLDLRHNPRLELVKEKTDKGSVVYRAVAATGGGEMEIFIKTFFTPDTVRIMLGRAISVQGLKKPWHYPTKIARLALERSPSIASFQAALACNAAGVAVAEPLLFLASGRGWTRREVLISRGVNPRSAPNARQYFQLHMKPPLAPGLLSKKRELVVLLGNTLARVRKSQVMFPDFKLHNLILEEPPGQAPRFVVIDLSEAVTKKPYPEFVFLERFSPHVLREPAFTGTDYARMINAYLTELEDQRPWTEICRGITSRARTQGRTINDMPSAGPRKRR